MFNYNNPYYGYPNPMMQPQPQMQPQPNPDVLNMMGFLFQMIGNNPELKETLTKNKDKTIGELLEENGLRF